MRQEVVVRAVPIIALYVLYFGPTQMGMTEQIEKNQLSQTKKENEIELYNGLDTLKRVRVATISEEITQSRIQSGSWIKVNGMAHLKAFMGLTLDSAVFG